MQKETIILQKIHRATGAKGYSMFRNDTGAYKAPNGQYIPYGLCKGSADLIGWESKVITPDMVGQKVAIFTAFEVKTETGKLSKEQKQFLNGVENAGGNAKVLRCVEDLD